MCLQHLYDSLPHWKRRGTLSSRVNYTHTLRRPYGCCCFVKRYQMKSHSCGYPHKFDGFQSFIHFADVRNPREPGNLWFTDFFFILSSLSFKFPHATKVKGVHMEIN